VNQVAGEHPPFIPAPLIVAVAPNGARKTKTDHAAIPLTAGELADEAARCRDAGASMIHLHVRDAEQGHILDADLYREATEAIRGAVGDELIVQITTEAVGIYRAPEQMAVVRDVVPEAISTAIRELIPDAASEAEAERFYGWAADESILVQYILYDAADVERFADLRKRGVLPDGPTSVLYVLGRYSVGQRSQPSDLLPFLEAARGHDADWHWSVCAFGPLEGACALTAAGLGGHVRVGMENNMLLSDGSLAPDNAALVRQVSSGAGSMGRVIADAGTARDILNRSPYRVGEERPATRAI